MNESRVQCISIPQQLPLCMIGDSITWAEYGDFWRKYMLRHLPRLAFIGNHTGCLGYSHEGEGGNNTAMVLDRLDRLPLCPYYHLHIGTNDNSLSGEYSPAELTKHINEVSLRIFRIVEELLRKPDVEKVFLGTIMACYTDNPKRDMINSKVNAVLRKKIHSLFPDDRVVLIDYEDAIRSISGWEQIIRLHPVPDGYEKIAAITAKAIFDALDIADPETVPVPQAGTGVKIINLWDQKNGRSLDKIIAGWYTLSFEAELSPPIPPRIRIFGDLTRVKFYFDQSFYPQICHDRWYINFFTGYEGYEYNMTVLRVESAGGSPRRILLEKTRPSFLPSSFGDTTFSDSSGRFAIGEDLTFSTP